MSNITVRYQCDGCYLEADTIEELRKIEVKIWRGKSAYVDTQYRLYCNECFEDRKLRPQFREMGQ